MPGDVTIRTADGSLIRGTILSADGRAAPMTSHTRETQLCEDDRYWILSPPPEETQLYGKCGLDSGYGDPALCHFVGDVPLIPGGLRPWQRKQYGAMGLSLGGKQREDLFDVVYRTTYDLKHSRFWNIYGLSGTSRHAET